MTLFVGALAALNAAFAVHGALSGDAAWIVAINAGVAVFCAISSLVRT